MTKILEPRIIESTAGEIAAELERLGVAPDQPVTVTIQPDHWLADVRRQSRPRVISAGWSDEDIDQIIDEERKAVQSGLK
ncbi:MAG TPA: hypothetical protein VHU42_11710 [Rhodopila sp.]|jgi:hypothetical protein|nr:hypothetical protein [Rhodopila sp.]